MKNILARTIGIIILVVVFLSSVSGSSFALVNSYSKDKTLPCSPSF